MGTKLNKSSNLFRDKRFMLFIFLIIVGQLVQGASLGTKQSLRNAFERFDIDFIVSDEIFTNVNAMSIGQIQAFLESRNSPLADKDLYQKYYLTYPIDMEIYNLVFPTGKLARKSSPAEIIYCASNLQFNPNERPNLVNPQILIILLQLNQNIIGDSTSLNQFSIDTALNWIDEKKFYISGDIGFINQILKVSTILTDNYEYFKNRLTAEKKVPLLQRNLHHSKNAGTFALRKILKSSIQVRRFCELFKVYFGNILSNTLKDISVPLPVPFFSQRDCRWASDQLGTCPYWYVPCGTKFNEKNNNINNFGCFITSTAMVFNYYHANFTNPGELNNCLRNNNGYEHGCDKKWDNKCAPPEVEYAEPPYWGSLSQLSSTIDAELRAGYPVLADVYTDSVNKHMVVITAKAGSTYLINDPWADKPGNTLSNGALGTYHLRKIHRYHGPVGPSNKTLVRVAGTDPVYWLQNNTLYWVTTLDRINQMSSLPG